MEDEIRSIIGKVKGIHSFSSVIMKINTMITRYSLSRDIALEIRRAIAFGECHILPIQVTMGFQEKSLQ